MFNKKFDDKNLDQLISDFGMNGFVEIENIFNEDVLVKLEKTIQLNKDTLNTNSVSGGYKKNYFFLSNFLSLSEEFYKFCTSKTVFLICEKILGKNFFLRSSRYYETTKLHGTKNAMPWHTDNKNNHGYVKNRGLVFLIYLNDSEGGETQFIKGSQNWTDENEKNSFQVDENDPKVDIITFKTLTNKLVIYDSRGVHQALMSNNSSFMRKTLFLQIDEEPKTVVRSDERNCEPVIINSQFLKNMTKELEYFLSFGVQHTYNNTTTEFKSMPYKLLTFKKYMSFLVNHIFVYVSETIKSNSLVRFLFKKKKIKKSL